MVMICRVGVFLFYSWQENGFFVADSVSVVFLKAVASSKGEFSYF